MDGIPRIPSMHVTVTNIHREPINRLYMQNLTLSHDDGLTKRALTDVVLPPCLEVLSQTKLEI